MNEMTINTRIAEWPVLRDWINAHDVVRAEWIYKEVDGMTLYAQGPVSFRMEADTGEHVRVAAGLWKQNAWRIHVTPRNHPSMYRVG